MRRYLFKYQFDPYSMTWQPTPSIAKSMAKGDAQNKHAPG
jgi:hypothetical protein